MDYQPKILINRTGKTLEFFCGGQLFIFKSGEKKLLDGEEHMYVQEPEER